MNKMFVIIALALVVIGLAIVAAWIMTPVTVYGVPFRVNGWQTGYSYDCGNDSNLVLSFPSATADYIRVNCELQASQTADCKSGRGDETTCRLLMGGK